MENMNAGKKYLLSVALLLLALLAWKTWRDMRPFPPYLDFAQAQAYKVQILDRQQLPLTVTYQNYWNLHDYRGLHEIPAILQQAFIFAEDKRFFSHLGVDWQARWHALLQNLLARRIVRGASTITEQSVRMLHPRPRTFWSRWLETFEAIQLERRFSKGEILEFYLNQIHYARQLRGVAQAARHYFDRELDTLNLQEMLTLAVLVRSPSRLDLRSGDKDLSQPLEILAQRMQMAGFLQAQEVQVLHDARLELHSPELPVQATHFVQHIYQDHAQQPQATGSKLVTTLDAVLQGRAQAILDQRLESLRDKGVRNGAALIVDYQTREILAWVNAGQLDAAVPGSHIDAVTTLRQPGSTLKPFIYALALENGWTAATLIEDSPLSESVGVGLHSYRNYSRSYHGWLRLRDALGNSLNVPAVRTVQFVGVGRFLQTLHNLGMYSLDAHPDFYGDGLALGNGEISLLELVQAYASLAADGQFQPLRSLLHEDNPPPQRVFSSAVSAIIANILSDSDARRLEFGSGALLRFPVQTAVKTGTSNDYHDAWAVGFNHHYCIGVWLGNLDNEPMAQVSGSSGSALVLRSLFAEVSRFDDTRALPLPSNLVRLEICRDTGLPADKNCASRTEWFVPGTEPSATQPHVVPNPATPDELRLRQPSPGLQMAMDPRIPDEYEAFTLALNTQFPDAEEVEWWVDGEIAGVNQSSTFVWNLEPGTHQVQARVYLPEGIQETPAVEFVVKK